MAVGSCDLLRIAEVLAVKDACNWALVSWFGPGRMTDTEDGAKA